MVCAQCVDRVEIGDLVSGGLHALCRDPRAERGQGLIQAGPFPVGAGEAMIEVDPLLGDAELAEPFALGGEFLLVGAAAGVADQGVVHGRQRTVSPDK